MTVFPLVDGEAGRFGPHRPEDLPELLRLLAELHRATPVVAADAPRTELVLPGRDALDDALDDLDRAWTSGPYAEPTAVALYRQGWDLADIASYVAGFRRPHGAGADAADSWTYLNSHLT